MAVNRTDMSIGIASIPAVPAEHVQSMMIYKLHTVVKSDGNKSMAQRGSDIGAGEGRKVFI